MDNGNMLQAIFYPSFLDDQQPDGSGVSAE